MSNPQVSTPTQPAPTQPVQTQKPTVQNNYPPVESTLVGKAWKNDTKLGEVYNITINKDIILSNINETCSFVLLPNNFKRTEINPKTGVQYKDSDFNLLIQIPKKA